VVFVGTFDPRKGMRDFPRIVSDTIAAVPDCRFKFLGTKGMLRTAAEVYAQFPRRLRGAIYVVPEFNPSDLPALFADCSIGVFPSVVEGFPFAVLEMLVAGLPVVAYQAPGAPMMVSDDFLVERGNAAGVAKKLVGLLGNRDLLYAARVWARNRSNDFDWDDIARRTASRYAAWSPRTVTISR
jgi:glycosyltransferase involved in cell wall biosynthesis